LRFLIILVVIGITTLNGCSSFDKSRFSVKPTPIINYENLGKLNNTNIFDFEILSQDVINSLDGILLTFQYKTFFPQ
jgi:hypothetical protein